VDTYKRSIHKLTGDDYCKPEKLVGQPVLLLIRSFWFSHCILACKETSKAGERVATGSKLSHDQSNTRWTLRLYQCILLRTVFLLSRAYQDLPHENIDRCSKRFTKKSSWSRMRSSVESSHSYFSVLPMPL
jgi:hypothetical protein